MTTVEPITVAAGAIGPRKPLASMAPSRAVQETEMSMGTASMDDPLVPISGRFSLGRARTNPPVNEETPSSPHIRPFGLRFAQLGDTGGEALRTMSLCPTRQIALMPDGTPHYYRIDDLTRPTTGPSPDGHGSPNEEWTPDYIGDEANP